MNEIYPLPSNSLGTTFQKIFSTNFSLLFYVVLPNLIILQNFFRLSCLFCLVRDIYIENRYLYGAAKDLPTQRQKRLTRDTSEDFQFLEKSSKISRA